MGEYPRVAGPPTKGATGEDVGPYPEEIFADFERQIQLRGWRIYKRQEQRMRELGLL